MCNENVDELREDPRTLQDFPSPHQHQQEIVIHDSTGYEVVLNKQGKEIFVPNILGFEFHQNASKDKANNVGDFRYIGEFRREDFDDFISAPDARPKFSHEKEDEIYEEHFEIDTSVYDQSGCKIMPGSCTKVNKKLIEQKDKKKRKTKGVANKHLLKAFNDADQNQGAYDADIDEDLQYLDDDDDDEALDDDVEKQLSGTEEGNISNNQISESDPTLEPAVNICYVEDVRHWEMLPREVRRKNDEDDFDDKYSVASKRTPDDKKKGKKKKDKKHKAQPMSLTQLSFQF